MALGNGMSPSTPLNAGGKAGGGLNHESREINVVFHDPHKFFEGFTFHVKSVRDGMIIVP